MNGNLLIRFVLLWLFICGLSDFDGKLTTLVTLGAAACNYGYTKWKDRRKRLELTDERKEQIKKIMKEPSPLEVTDYEEKIRRNLILSSSLAIVFTVLGLQLSPSSRFLGGIQFDNITSELVYFILLAVIVYESVHYFWLVRNKFKLWCVRLTGTGNIEGVRPQEGSFSEGIRQEIDYGGLSENSNFYTWMFELEKPIQSISNTWQEQWRSLDSRLFTDSENSSQYYSEQMKKLNEIYTATEQLTNALENARINASMVAFDNCYDSLVRSQSWRWVILDVLLPALLSISAIGFIGYELYTMDSSLESHTGSIATKVTSYTFTVEVKK